MLAKGLFLDGAHSRGRSDTSRQTDFSPVLLADKSWNKSEEKELLSSCFYEFFWKSSSYLITLAICISQEPLRNSVQKQV